MKAFIASFFISSLGLAALKPIGTFTGNYCGTTQDKKVEFCFGTVSGIKGDFVSIQEGSAPSSVYRITSREPQNAGINPFMRSEKLTLKNSQQVLTARVSDDKSKPGSTFVRVQLSSGQTLLFTDFQSYASTM